MKDDFNLDAALKAAKIPDRPTEYWEDFPRQTVARLRRKTAAHERKIRWFPRFASATTFAAIFVIIGFGIGHWRGQSENSAENLLQNGKLIQETVKMFPNRVRAIVQNKDGLDLILSENRDVPISTPIYVRICDGRQCASVVTFSGEEIQIAGKKMTVLSDAQGGVILEGSDFVWSSLERTYAKSGLKIEAKRLTAIRM